MCMVVAVRVVVDRWFAAYQCLVQYCDTVVYSMNMRQHKCTLALSGKAPIHTRRYDTMYASTHVLFESQVVARARTTVLCIVNASILCLL